MSQRRLYDFALSGHAHRARLMLSLLGLPHEIVAVDLKGGAHKRPDFLALNPFGQVPVLVDGDAVIADSNAILVYLAGRYDETGRWLPRDPLGQAQVQRWLSAAAGPLAFGPAAARVATLFGAPLDIARAHQIASGLFAVMEQELGRRPFLIGEAPTIADVALYSYTAHAPEGGVSLTLYPHVRAWLSRIADLPGFVPMQASPVAGAA
ncbi:glutathione S-transferase [Bradyrhizobium sp. SSBR45G]|uniref:glutathione S-transferase family protein n=1 Tax=unclassified Bradyrhizobium TaxID=2631580 RepID=UPI002342B70C|nr:MULTISPECIES: glutathione S-transferase [unclassified Bradyrhizobium]GLH78196.1 glutathione S-transferase [Bradyrhizobium sp. SSBR45G]GLH86037.1 glutathione S-transferase [Bradyrhizobium sp. SSBR45R]